LLVVGGVHLESRRRHNRRLEKLERLQVVERERSRIAQDMHDELGANLTRISLLSQTAKAGLRGEPEASQYLHQIYTSARELTRGMDEIVWAVNPHHDTLESLLNYLTRFAFEFLKSADIRCRMNLPVQIPDWKVRAEVRHNLFLASKEALNNSIKHSGAKEVRVSLQLLPGGFELRIEDDGTGFDVSSSQRGAATEDRFAPANGLSNIYSRLRAIGGHAEITRSSGRGTLVVFFVPIENNDAKN
jgi:signal transduction histidine kinase